MSRRYFRVIPATVLVAGCLWFVMTPKPAAESEPTTPRMTPFAAPSLDLVPAEQAAATLPRLHSLLVSWRGNVVVERYYNGARATRPANLKSASKSVISALVGIAIGNGLIPDVKQPIGTYFPEELRGSINEAKRNITIENLLTMQAGLQSTSNRNYGAWVLSRNWVQYALRQPLESAPGDRMQYSTGNTHLLSAILTKASRANTWQFAQNVLAGPLGFSLPRWPQDPQGIYFGGNDMLMTPRQMVAFGEMYLNHGQYQRRQVVPADWVDASFMPRVESPREFGRAYGYGWWLRDMAGYTVNYAWGYGGQFIFVIPKLELVAVTTSVSEASTERRDHLRAIYDLVEEFVVKPIAAQYQSESIVN